MCVCLSLSLCVCVFALPKKEARVRQSAIGFPLEKPRMDANPPVPASPIAPRQITAHSKKYILGTGLHTPRSSGRSRKSSDLSGCHAFFSTVETALGVSDGRCCRHTPKAQKNENQSIHLPYYSYHIRHMLEFTQDYCTLLRLTFPPPPGEPGERRTRM